MNDLRQKILSPFLIMMGCLLVIQMGIKPIISEGIVQGREQVSRDVLALCWPSVSDNKMYTL